MDCGYKFRLRSRSISKRYVNQERPSLTIQKSRSLKRIFVLVLAFIIVFSLGLTLGYRTGLSNAYTKTITISKIITISYTVSQTFSKPTYQMNKTYTIEKVYTTTTGYGFGGEMEVWNIKPGETIIISNGRLALTVMDIKISNFYIRKFVERYCEYRSDENYKFVLVYIKIDNLYKSEMPFPSLGLDMVIITDKGYEYRYDPAAGSETSCSNRIEDLRGYLCEVHAKSVRPGESVTKCYIFEIKEDHQPAVLRFLVPEQYPELDKMINVTIE